MSLWQVTLPAADMWEDTLKKRNMDQLWTHLLLKFRVWMSANCIVHGRSYPTPLPSILARKVSIAQEMSLYLPGEPAHSCQDNTHL